MLPSAIVAITLKRLTKLDAGLLAGSKRPYLLASIDQRRFGRSRLLPAAGGDFDLTQEVVAWTHEVPVSGSDVPIKAEIWDDRGDDAPKLLATIQGVVPVPYFTMELTLGGSPALVLDVAARDVPAAVTAAPVPRVAAGQTNRATLRPVNSLVVELTNIDGLYAPLAPGAAGRLRSEKRKGYLSHDNLGRAYLNHDLTKNWKSKVQQLMLEAKVTAVRGVVPSDAKVRWRLLDLDDPSNDATGVHQQWGKYLDAKDYAADGTPKGATADDNEGKPAKSPPWEGVAGFALSDPSATSAASAIVGGESKVIFDCPSTAGDNFIILAEVESTTSIESFGTRTGVISMWHRLHVESIRMNSGLALPTTEVPVPFEAAFVELEFEPDTTVADRPQMAPTDDKLSDECTKYVDSVFTHKDDPGWFCIISAMEPHVLPAQKGKEIYSGPIKLFVGGVGSNHYEYFELTGSFPNVDYAELTFGAHSVGFSLFGIEVVAKKSGDITRCWIDEHDAQPEFTAGDGSIAHAYAVSYAYSPRFRKKGAVVKSGGYGAPATVTARVFEPGAFYTSGISPTVRRGKKSYFAGRTIIFTHHGAYRDATTGAPKPGFHDKALQVMVHELVHAFGMPHKCGYYDYRTPREKTCCMNYSPNWMLDDQFDLIAGTDRKVGMEMCGRHLKEVRRVRLQDNAGLSWK